MPDKTKFSDKITIVPLEPEDMAAVVAIEKASAITPFAATQFFRELALPNAHLYVAKEGDKILGYIDFWLVADEVEIINIAVAPGARQKGIGSALIMFLIQLSAKHKARRITLEVRKSNIAAQALYQKFEFAQVSVRRRYYQEPVEDGLVFQRLVES